MTIDTYNMTISLTYYVIQYYIYYCVLNIFMYKQYLWALGCDFIWKWEADEDC